MKFKNDNFIIFYDSKNFTLNLHQNQEYLAEYLSEMIHEISYSYYRYTSSNLIFSGNKTYKKVIINGNSYQFSILDIPSNFVDLLTQNIEFKNITLNLEEYRALDFSDYNITFINSTINDGNINLPSNVSLATSIISSTLNYCHINIESNNNFILKNSTFNNCGICAQDKQQYNDFIYNSINCQFNSCYYQLS